jgi:hypothetical protein
VSEGFKVWIGRPYRRGWDVEVGSWGFFGGGGVIVVVEIGSVMVVVVMVSRCGCGIASVGGLWEVCGGEGIVEWVNGVGEAGVGEWWRWERHQGGVVRIMISLPVPFGRGVDGGSLGGFDAKCYRLVCAAILMGLVSLSHEQPLCNERHKECIA